MKKLLNILCVAFVLFGTLPTRAQEEEKPEPSIAVRYFNQNGRVQFLKVKALLKENGKFRPLEAVTVKLFLDTQAEENLVGVVKTDASGEAVAIIPPALKEKWMATPTHTFLAAIDGTNHYAATTTETEVKKLKIQLDTLNEEGTRKVTAQVFAFDSSWKPAGNVELKIAVRRLGGDLNIGEEETYTTDSLGQASGEFKLDRLPATDARNNITLVAKTEDNDVYGNVSYEKTVPWGLTVKAVSIFDKRTLWATRDKAPIWLMGMAYSIILAVWSVIIYLVLQIRKMKKLGKQVTEDQRVSIPLPEAAEA